MRHQYFQSILKNSESELKYFWFHLSDSSLSTKLDFERSTFWKTEYTFKKSHIDSDSFETYQQLKKKDKNASFGVELEFGALSSTFDRSLDLFTFLPFTNDVFISPRLMQSLQIEKISGLKFEKANLLKSSQPH